jgi:type III secretion protein S
MDVSGLTAHLDRTLLLVLYLSAPVLGVAAAVGLVVGLAQAVTQIQDQSLPQVLKLVAILVTVVLAGPLLAGALVRETRAILDSFAALVPSGVGS